MADRICNLTNGVSFGAKYTVVAEDVAVDAVAEVLTLTVTEGCTTDGNVSISLRGATAVDIAVTTDADTPAEVATLIAAGTFTGWTQAAVDNVVTFTASVAGAKTGTNTVDVATTGVVGAIEVKTLGAAAIPGSVTFAFRSLGSDTEVPYGLAASIQVVTSANVYVPTTDAVITYPANGKVKITDGTTTFKLAAGQIIYVVAQRVDEAV
jgi:hypothetical protein